MDFKNKKIAVIGAGVEGISTVKYLAKKGAQIHLLDKKNEEDIDTIILEEIQKSKVNFKFGPNYLYSLQDFEIIFRSPGTRPDLIELINAKEKGIQISSQIKYFFDHCPATIVGITGTKGKGTTSALIHEILKEANKETFLGGNIGTPPLDFLDKVTEDSVVVLELSSFQLMDLEKSPHVAVVLGVTSEHMDWHKNINEYIEAKKNMLKNQTENDFVIIGKDSPLAKEIGDSSHAEKYYISTNEVVNRGAYLENDEIVLVTDSRIHIANVSDVQLRGRHNFQNILAAAVVTKLLEIKPDSISKIVTTFKGLPHRLEFVKEINEVKYFDDSASTNVETAIAAINSFENPKILILGGASKNSDFTPLGQEIAKKNIKSVILIGAEANRIQKSIERAGKFSGEIFTGLKNMDEVVKKTRQLASAGDIVLLTPACASFDMFKNYKDRGVQFKEIVRGLNKSNILRVKKDPTGW